MRSSTPNGFTLLEVLVVLAILISSFTALSQVQTTALKEAAEVEEKTSVQAVCQNELDKILSGINTAVPFQQIQIPEFSDWVITVQLDQIPFPELVRIRLTAQKCEYTSLPADRPGVFNLVRKPVAEVTISQWADPDTIRIAGRTPNTADHLDGPRPQTAVEKEGTGPIGSLTAVPAADPYSAIDQFTTGSLASPADPFSASGFTSSFPPPPQ